MQPRKPRQWYMPPEYVEAGDWWMAVAEVCETLGSAVPSDALRCEEFHMAWIISAVESRRIPRPFCTNRLAVEYRAGMLKVYEPDDRPEVWVKIMLSEVARGTDYKWLMIHGLDLLSERRKLAMLIPEDAPMAAQLAINHLQRNDHGELEMR